MKRVAIVNRGEPAVRFARALREYAAEHDIALTAVALYTDPDAGAPFVRLADEAVALGPALRADGNGGTRSAYTDHAHLFAAIEDARCDAVWPGWGFVAEDAEFVAACEARGITFIGPSAAAMRRLGDKIASKALADQAGVPMAPWALIDGDMDAAALAAAAEPVGFPLIVKASAGGGGRGIRKVDDPADLHDAVERVIGEANRSFGGGGVFLEACVTGARHLEVQLVVGADGKAATLGVRDCTIQRRHQKIWEETPSPSVSTEMADRLCRAAERLGEAADYRGVGTVEFLVDPSRDFAHFLEVNTRLQVEHTITEQIFSVDLVHAQLDIARGLPWQHGPLEARGHAIEVRLNAEDPERDFQPSPGMVRAFRTPAGPGVRVDSGIVAGSAIASEFDPMIAKLIVTGRDRNQALARLRRALAELEVVVEDGATNKAFLLKLATCPGVVDGSVDTGWLDREGVGAVYGAGMHAYEAEALATAAILEVERAQRAAVGRFFAEAQSGVPYRFEPPRGTSVELRLRGQSHEIEVHEVAASEYLAGPVGALAPLALSLTDAHGGLLSVGGAQRRVLFSLGRAGWAIEVDGVTHHVEHASGGKVRAPAPALVVSVAVIEGQTVHAGDRLCTLEAMKMEMPVYAPEAGVIKTVLCAPNQQVPAGQPLMVIEADSDGAEAAAAVQETTIAAAPRPIDRLFAGGDADPAYVDGLADEDAEAVVDDVAELVRSVLLGYDIPGACRQQLEALFAAEDVFATLQHPARWRPLIELMTMFPDVEGLFERNLFEVEGEAAQISAQIAFYDFCREHHRGKDGIRTGFEVLLTRALGHYGIHTFEPSDALREALWRLAIAHADAGPRHQLASQLLRLTMALHAAGADFSEVRRLAVVLSRTAELAAPRFPFVRDNARQARYLLFRRPRHGVLPHAAPSIYAQLMALTDTAITEHAAGNNALQSLIAGLYEGTPGQIVLGPGWITRTVTSVGGHEVLAVLVAPDALATALAELSPPQPGAVLDVFVAGTLDADAALATLDGASRQWAEVILTSVGDDERARHASYNWEPARRAWAVSDPYEGVHPERAQRLELWRLEAFDLDRLDAPEPLLAYRIRAKANPRDARLVVYTEVGMAPAVGRAADPNDPGLRDLAWQYDEALRVIREVQSRNSARERYYLNRIVVHVRPVIKASARKLVGLAKRFEAPSRGLGLQKLVVQARVENRHGDVERKIFTVATRGRHRLEVAENPPSTVPMRAATEYYLKVERCRRWGLVYPYEIVRMLRGDRGANAAWTPHPDLADGRFVELELNPKGRLVQVKRTPGTNPSGVVVGLMTHATRKHPEGLTRVWIASDPTKSMGALAEPECRRIIAAIDLAEARRLPVEWLPISAGAKIAMDSGTENLDWTARVLRRIVSFTQGGGPIHIIVSGINVGAQSYWNAEATMLMHTQGALILTTDGSMVLTGKKALEVSGSVAAEDERGIGGFDRVMGPNGQAQYVARDMGDAYRILFEHYAFTYVAPGETGPRPSVTTDPRDRSVLEQTYKPANGELFKTIGDLFSEAMNPGRKRPFVIREVMRAVIDTDGGSLPRFAAMEAADTALVWDAHIGGHAVSVIGFESRPRPRRGVIPLDGPDTWFGGTLYPQSSKKVARAINSASGNRPVVVLANLSGFDGSPESMRRLQLEYGAEIGRAVVNFDGPIVFVVIGRYHGGAYVVFSKALNPRLTSLAVSGSYASVIGGAPAAAVVFPREVRKRADADPRVKAAKAALAAATASERPKLREALEATRGDVLLEHQGAVAQAFDAIHTVQRAVEVGSLDAVIAPARLRPAIIDVLDAARDEARADERRRQQARPIVNA